MPGNARTTVLLVIAKENKLDIDFVETNPDYELSGKYLALNPLKRIPTFEAPDGWVLSEVIAIAIYCTSLCDSSYISFEYLFKRGLFFHFLLGTELVVD